MQKVLIHSTLTIIVIQSQMIWLVKIAHSDSFSKFSQIIVLCKSMFLILSQAIIIKGRFSLQYGNHVLSAFFEVLLPKIS